MSEEPVDLPYVYDRPYDPDSSGEPTPREIDRMAERIREGRDYGRLKRLNKTDGGERGLPQVYTRRMRCKVDGIC